MKRYIQTGPPGAGKTSILRALERRGCPVVGEAATDVVLQAQRRGDQTPWTSAGFIDDIVSLQSRRQQHAESAQEMLRVFDRSPVCTLALARFLGFEMTRPLAAELERIQRDHIYERRVFFVEGLGFMTSTEVRRISLEDARRFGEVHEAAYRELGYELIRVPPGPVEQRAGRVLQLLEAWREPSVDAIRGGARPGDGGR
jgi:predicted ATPase